MLERLNNDDWNEAFGYAGEPGACGNPNVCAVLGSDAPTTPFTREDVAEIIAIADGENDGEDWIGVFRLRDGRFAYLSAGCDFTGWDCRAKGCARVAMTLDTILRLALTDRDRERLREQLPKPTYVSLRSGYDPNHIKITDIMAVWEE